MKKWTDAEFEIVKGAPPRKELPGWFKALLLGFVALTLLAIPIWRFNEAHSDSPPGGPATTAPQEPPAR